ncbi:hypothetical protein KY290_022164 [Solanum tuberosum]|uniref:Uncharacterized protein n=1 Tax=Solanum tuberosum TaxID=4113 RepID=A0ABQ7V3P0_SOLTU|nr:hypothetical protein KY289_021295 [Solanum tuberosum]KAH0758671.1 hypothetical protein KY290_022164 [Solanum tuberosum]
MGGNGNKVGQLSIVPILYNFQWIEDESRSILARTSESRRSGHVERRETRAVAGLGLHFSGFSARWAAARRVGVKEEEEERVLGSRTDANCIDIVGGLIGNADGSLWAGK